MSKQDHIMHPVSYDYVFDSVHKSRIYCHYCKKQIAWCERYLADWYAIERTTPIILDQMKYKRKELEPYRIIRDQFDNEEKNDFHKYLKEFERKHKEKDNFINPKGYYDGN